MPKFHCELNPIEACWGQAKRYTRAHCNYSFQGLEKTVNPGLNSITLDHIRKFYRKERDIMHAYREGVSAGPDLEKALKQHKSHHQDSKAGLSSTCIIKKIFCFVHFFLSLICSFFLFI